MENKFENTPEFGKDIIEFEQDFFVGNNFTTVFSPGVVYANGKSCEVKVYWDTGSSISSISYSTAKQLGLKIKQSKAEDIITANGSITKRTCYANFFVCTPDGSSSFKKENVCLLIHKSRQNAPCVLLLGMDFISHGLFITVRNKKILKMTFKCGPYDN